MSKKQVKHEVKRSQKSALRSLVQSGKLKPGDEVYDWEEKQLLATVGEDGKVTLTTKGQARDHQEKCGEL